MPANPTGLSDAMTTMTHDPNRIASPVMGGTYPTGGPGSYNYGNATNPNPPGTGTGAGAPTVSMAPGGTGAQPFDPTQFGQGSDPKNLRSKLSDVFGSGLGPLIQDFLQKGQGGYNEALTKQSVDAQIAGMQTNINRGYGTLNTELGQQGISPLSSTAALEKGFYMSEATTQENALLANEYYNMWNQSMGREYGLLGEVAGASHEHQGNAGDWAKQFAEVGQGIGGMIGGAGYTSSGGGGFTL